ncbi:hypothetical protein LJK87_14550 [Paenibacillus sp. P25]|nr:hypothetical protein LJK87_14550 [Paenibacillus sp. P25]
MMLRSPSWLTSYTWDTEGGAAVAAKEKHTLAVTMAPGSRLTLSAGAEFAQKVAAGRPGIGL